MTTITEKLDGVISKLTKTKDITAVAVISKNGLLMVSNDQSDNSQTFAAMAATMFVAAETATTEIENWVPDRVIVEAEDSNLITIAAGPKSLLVVQIDSNTKLGIVLHDMKGAAQQIQDILS